MKEQKRAWLEKIGKLEVKAVRYFRIGCAVRILCHLLAFVIIVGGIGIAGLAGFEVWTQPESARAMVCMYTCLMPLAGIGVMSVIALDLFVLSPLLNKSFKLGCQAGNLKKNGWNK